VLVHDPTRIPASPSASHHDLQLSPETLLQLAPGVRTRFDAAGHVLVDAPDGTVIDLGPRGFATLSLFSRPLALGQAIDRLEADDHSSTEFLPTLSVINMLLEEGALVRPGAGRGPTRGWADPVEHARMLHDQRRTGDYLAALAEAVRPGDVVVDVGTGSGVLAVAAARAGARRVYAVEASDIAEVAERVFAANGVQDQITLVRGWSRQIELPERADLLVSEIIGNEPFEEELLETTLDARRRLLKPQARLIPHTLTLLVRPLLLPEVEARQRAIGDGAVERWRGLYGIEFQALLDAAPPGPVHTPTEGEVVAGWPPVGPPVVLATLDLTALDEVSVDAGTELVVDGAGMVNAVAMTFRADLHGAIAHTLDPWRWPASSWATSVWMFPDRLHVGPGAVLGVHYSRRVPGRPDRLSYHVVERGASHQGES
jgi:protein arginine N-methyltransferase 1